MFELNAAYDDLVALRRALNVSQGMMSRSASGELNAVLRFTVARVYVALHALDDEDRDESIEALDALYEGRGQAKIE